MFKPSYSIPFNTNLLMWDRNSDKEIGVHPGNAASFPAVAMKMLTIELKARCSYLKIVTTLNFLEESLKSSLYDYKKYNEHSAKNYNQSLLYCQVSFRPFASFLRISVTWRISFAKKGRYRRNGHEFTLLDEDQDCPNDRQHQRPLRVVQCRERGATRTSHAAFAKGSRL